ncbi:hypothetical protein JW979_16370, partial [bacterium]|nr:hypothetical protein [candidate division CSSED10-310 bacterium]
MSCRIGRQRRFFHYFSLAAVWVSLWGVGIANASTDIDRALDYLVSCQTESGSWRSGNAALPSESIVTSRVLESLAAW